MCYGRTISVTFNKSGRTRCFDIVRCQQQTEYYESTKFGGFFTEIWSVTVSAFSSVPNSLISVQLLLVRINFLNSILNLWGLSPQINKIKINVLHINRTYMKSRSNLTMTKILQLWPKDFSWTKRFQTTFLVIKTCNM